jgi:hypothetical protein
MPVLLDLYSLSSKLGISLPAELSFSLKLQTFQVEEALVDVFLKQLYLKHRFLCSTKLKEMLDWLSF